jgi:aspartate/methionine/tyrosine aminotransferase
LGYTPNGGSLDLREQIATLYGDAITADNILVFAGAQIALQTAAHALAKGGHAIVFTPGYQSTVEAPAHAGAEVTGIRLKAANGWQIDPREVEAAIRPDTKYMVINEPYNPAGTLMKPEIQAELKALAARHGIYIMSDEVYRLLEHDPCDRLPAMAELYEKGISAVTLSKPWGGCGVTIGWLAFRDLSIKQRLVDVQYFGTACPSRASELQALMVLRSSERILEKNLAIIRRNLSLLESFVTESYPDLFAWVKPRAGATAFVEFTGPLTADELGVQLAAEGISMKPAYCFTDGAGLTKDIEGYFRVGYGEEVMPAALGALAAFVEARKEGWRATMAATATAATLTPTARRSTGGASRL